METFSENSIWVDVTKPFNTDYHIAEKTNIIFSSSHPFIVGDYLTENVTGATGILYENVSSVEINVARDSSTLFPVSGELTNGTEIFSYNSSSVTHGIDNDVNQRLVDRTKYLQDNKVDKTINISVGNGLTGGGNLTTNRTIALGTPSTITSTTANDSSGTTHTHAITKATESTLGIVRFATAAEYLAGTDGVALDPYNFLQYCYKSGNGYQRLPSGLIIQWGFHYSGNLVYHAFPITFPSVCVSVVTTMESSGNIDRNINVYSISNTGYYTATNTTHGCRWIAIGY